MILKKRYNTRRMSVSPDRRPGIPFLPDISPRAERQLAEGPRVLVYETPDDAAAAMAIATVGKLSQVDNPTVLLATGETMRPYYRKLIELSRTDHTIHAVLTRTTYGQLDNYVYRPEAYPHGPDQTDFSRTLLREFLDPMGIHEDRFLPLNGHTRNPEGIAKFYAKGLSLRRLTVVNFGLGPLPEVHLAYMREGTSFDADVHYVPRLEESVIARNKNRGENPPSEAITIGHKTYANAQYIQVLCFGADKAASLERALYGEITPRMVATGLRRPGLGNVEFYVDQAAAQLILAP